MRIKNNYQETSEVIIKIKDSYYEKNDVIRLRNEIIIFGNVFGIVQGRPYKKL
jgi:hypothetical protein